jgi:hypothetical protein
MYVIGTGEWERQSGVEMCGEDMWWTLRGRTCSDSVNLEPLHATVPRKFR